jgi:hypothetical protein
MTATEASSARLTRSGGGPVTSATNSRKSANHHGHPTEDGVTNSGAPAPAAPDLKQGKPAAQDMPTAKKSGILANSTALIVGAVALILVAMPIMALTRRRRSRGTYY